jgi:ubiquinone/menaquinone biosynthesis C-methylase UbiE
MSIAEATLGISQTPSEACESYKTVAPFYDALAQIYSGGAIGASREWVAAQIEADDRVLFAGCGSGLDAVLAVQRGACATVVDSSPAMLSRARGEFLKNRVQAEMLCADVLDLPGEGEYDAVVASFFLNVFDAEELPQVLSQLLSHLRPHGRLIIADFAALHSARWVWAQQLYHDLPMHLFHRLTDSAIHPVHDYRSTLAQMQAKIVLSATFRLFGCGPAWIEGIVATRGEVVL